MAPCTGAVIWFWPSPRSCLSLAALTPCLTSHPNPQPNASVLCNLADTNRWETVSKHGVELFLQQHFCVCIETKQGWGCNCEQSILQKLRKESSVSHVDGWQQPDSEVFCNKTPQCWNKAGSEIFRWHLSWRSYRVPGVPAIHIITEKKNCGGGLRKKRLVLAMLGKS